jgi:hypothetical protein
MRQWKSIAAGAAVAAMGLISMLLAGVLTGCQRSNVSANEKSSYFLGSSPLQFRQTTRMPAGTRIHVRLDDSISTERNSSGDRFAASLDGPLMADRRVLAPSRSRILGELVSVKESGRVSGRARLTITLKKLVVGSKEYDLETYPLTLVASSTVKRDAGVIAGSAAAGAAIGAIAGGGKGAAIGAGIGGGSGTGYVLATKGAPVAHGPESRFAFTLSQPLELPVYD